jgi:hypothetical protein
MGRRRNLNDPTVVAEFIAQGRGLGAGKGFHPWITTHDFHSRGIRVRAWWARTGRIHHLFSTLEHGHFLIFAADNSVVDIREQYPLLDFDRIARAAGRVRREYPNSRAGSQGNVLTTDLLVTREIDGRRFDEPYNVKYKRETYSEAFRYRKRLEEIYWEENPVPLRVLTEVEAPYNLVRSAEWVLQASWPHFLSGVSIAKRLEIARHLRAECEAPHDHLVGAARRIDHSLKLAPGTSIDVARWMLSDRRWTAAPCSAPFPSAPLSLAA